MKWETVWSTTPPPVGEPDTDEMMPGRAGLEVEEGEGHPAGPGQGVRVHVTQLLVLLLPRPPRRARVSGVSKGTVSRKEHYLFRRPTKMNQCLICLFSESALWLLTLCMSS
jgi:hypothetical protein